MEIQVLSSVRCVLYGDNIFIIGGMYWAGLDYGYVNKVHILNTITDQVTLSDDRLVCNEPDSTNNCK